LIEKYFLGSAIADIWLNFLKPLASL